MYRGKNNLNMTFPSKNCFLLLGMITLLWNICYFTVKGLIDVFISNIEQVFDDAIV